MSCRLADEESLPRSQTLESKWMAKSLLNYVSRHKDRIDALFELLGIFTSSTRISFYFLKAYAGDRVALDYTLEEQQKVGNHFGDLWGQGETQATEATRI